MHLKGLKGSQTARVSLIGEVTVLAFDECFWKLEILHTWYCLDQGRARHFRERGQRLPAELDRRDRVQPPQLR